MIRDAAAQRHPLNWPAGWRRTPAGERRRARFLKVTSRYNAALQRNTSMRGELSVFEAVRRLQVQLNRLGADEEILSTNVELRLDGQPRSDRRTPSDPGAAVYFTMSGGKPRVLACDRWDRVADNIAALAAHIEAIRAVDRYGVGTLEQAFAGYRALAASASEWWQVLELTPSATRLEAEEAHRRLAKQHHPDVGGSHDTMAKLNEALETARALLT